MEGARWGSQKASGEDYESRHLNTGGSKQSFRGQASRQRGSMCKGPGAEPARRPQQSRSSLRRLRGKTQGELRVPASWAFTLKRCWYWPALCSKHPLGSQRCRGEAEVWLEERVMERGHSGRGGGGNG